MPEFEETQPNANSAQTYSPSDEAKPRTRRRSGGFKKEYNEAPKGSMGEIDPSEAFSSETLSSNNHAEKAVDQSPSEEEPRAERAPAPRRQPREAREEEAPRSTPQPDEATLAAVKRVEERIAQRKAERGAKAEARRKNAPERSAPKASGRNSKPSKPAAKTGLLATILKLFGLGPKPAHKPKGKGKPGNRNDRRDGPRGGGGRGGRGGRSRGGRGGRGRGGNGRQSAQSRDNS